MDSLELNKVVGAVLLGGMVALVSGILAEKLVEPRHFGGGAATAGGAAPAPQAPAAAALEPVSPLLAAADAKAGEAVFKKCASCHNADKGGKAKVGPDLWNVVGGPRAQFPGFAYSDALKSKGGNWDYEQLNEWLFSPKDFAPGTKMAFAGLKDVKDRANVIAWLRNQADTPAPLPDQAAIDAAKKAFEEKQAAAKPATTAAAPAAAAPAATQQAAATAAPIAERLKTADPAAGEKAVSKCKACHSFGKDEKNKVGPNLWDVVGGKKDHRDDFSYSDALKAKGGEWDYDSLDAWLTSPRTFVPGTKMAFAGVQDPVERANIIAYLRSLSDSPKPLP
jgi:cytochrome c